MHALDAGWAPRRAVAAEPVDGGSSSRRSGPSTTGISSTSRSSSGSGPASGAAGDGTAGDVGSSQVTISALEGLCVRLGSLREGRKAVILVSEGFTALLPPQMRDPMAALPGGQPRRAQSDGRRSTGRGPRAVHCRQVDLRAPDAGRLRRRQPQQHGLLRARPAGTCGRRVRHQRERQRHVSIPRRCASPWTPCGRWPTRPTGAPS